MVGGHLTFFQARSLAILFVEVFISERVFLRIGVYD